MRKQITKPTCVRKGDEVLIVCRLRSSQSYARLGLWSACEGDALSPHVPYGLIGMLYDGKPNLVTPTYVRLIADAKPKHTWRFDAEDDLTFCVIQEVDTKDEVLAKARIKSYGTTSARARRALQNLIGFLRRCAKGIVRYHA